MKKFAGMVVAAVLSFMCLKIVSAEEADIRLQEVVVTATKTEKDPKDVTQSVTVITADEIKKSGATNAAEAVKRTTGIAVNDYGSKGALKSITIRGSSYQQVLVLLDGKRMNSARAGGFDMSDLPVPLEDIERIEIVRGPASALYGADAVGGVVNIITKRPEKYRTTVSGSVGSNGYDSMNVKNAGKLNKFYYAVSGGRETYDGYRLNSDLDQKNTGAKIGYEIGEGSSLELTSNYIGKEMGSPGSTSWLTPNARQWNRQIVSGLTYQTKFSPEFGMKMQGYCNRDTLLYKDPDAFPPEDSRHKGVSRSGEIQGNWLVSTWNAVTFGAEARRDSLRSNTSGDHAASLWAGYVQDEISIGEPLILVMGGRYDDHSVYGNEFSPKASARYLIKGTETILRASAGKGFRAPTFNDLYWPDTGWAIGNPALRPETSKECEAGIEQPVGHKSAVRIASFERRVKDLIEWEFNTTTSKYNPVNIGRARIRGAEAEAKVKIAEPLTWAVNYTYMNPVNELTGEKIYYTIPKEQVKSSLNIEFGTGTNVYLEGRTVENYVQATDPAWRYSVMDGKVTQAVSFGQRTMADVFFGMNNIFDRRYETVRNYPMPPREIYGGVSVRF